MVILEIAKLGPDREWMWVRVTIKGGEVVCDDGAVRRDVESLRDLGGRLGDPEPDWTLANECVRYMLARIMEKTPHVPDPWPSAAVVRRPRRAAQKAKGKPAIGPKHPDYQRWLDYFTIQAIGANAIKIVLSIPEKVGRRTIRVVATLVDWTVVCGDAEIAARLRELRPDSPGYLPPQTGEWARIAEKVLSARVDAIEAPTRSDKWPDGVVC